MMNKLEVEIKYIHECGRIFTHTLSFDYKDTVSSIYGDSALCFLKGIQDSIARSENRVIYSEKGPHEDIWESEFNERLNQEIKK